jgi:hypothetical protein
MTLALFKRLFRKNWEGVKMALRNGAVIADVRIKAAFVQGTSPAPKIFDWLRSKPKQK